MEYLWCSNMKINIQPKFMLLSIDTHTHIATKTKSTFFVCASLWCEQKKIVEINYLQRFCSSGFHFGETFPIKSHVLRCSYLWILNIFAPNALHFLPWISTMVIGFCHCHLHSTKFDTVHQVFQVLHRKRLRIHWKVSSVVTQRNGSLPFVPVISMRKAHFCMPNISSETTLQISNKCCWLAFNAFNDLFLFFFLPLSLSLDSKTNFIWMKQTMKCDE